MHVMARESWTDERLDEFGRRMDERFDRVDERFETARQDMKQVGARLDRVEDKMERVDSRLHSMNRTMAIAAVAMSSSMIGGFGVLVAVLAAKL